MRLLYVVTEDWYFLSHRLPMARAARDAGFEVHVATRVVDGAAAIKAEGFILHPVPFVRGRISLFGTIATIRALRQIHRAVAPAIAHHVALQATVLGSLAALGRSVGCVNALTGLGYTFTSGNAKALLLRPIIGTLLRLAAEPSQAVRAGAKPRRPRWRALTRHRRGTHRADPGLRRRCRSAATDARAARSRSTVAYVGRLLADKGIHTLIRAHRLLRQRGSNVELLLAGTPDPANPASVSNQEAESWGREPGITWLGHVGDISALWARAHIAVLPSRREGLPKSLLEAAACGRPMIATDVPGCREVVHPGETGVLVPVDDERALADAIEALAASPELRARYGAAARQLAVERFSAHAIGAQTVDLYRRLMG